MKKLTFILVTFLISYTSFAGVGFTNPMSTPPLSPKQKGFINTLSNAPNAFLVNPPAEIQNYLKSVGINLNNSMTNQLQQEFQKIITLRYQAMMSTVGIGAVQAAFPYLSVGQATQLLKELYNGMNSGNLEPGDRLFATLFFIVNGIPLFTKKDLLRQQAKAVIDPVSPSSPTMTLAKNTMGGIVSNMTNNFKAKSSGLSLSNTYVAYDYSYQEYEFTDTDDAGHVHYNSLTFGGNLSEDFSFAFSFFQDQTDQRGTNDLLSNQLGANLAFTYNLNENYSIGAYGFYSEADIEEINDHVWTYGGGILFATYHSFGNLSVSTVNTVLKSYTNFDHDTLFLSNLRLGYQWTDELSTGIYSYYIDSIREPNEDDSSYMIFGADISYQLTDQVNVSVGIETVEFLKEYRSETLFFSLRYDF